MRKFLRAVQDFWGKTAKWGIGVLLVILIIAYLLSPQFKNFINQEVLLPQIHAAEQATGNAIRDAFVRAVKDLENAIVSALQGIENISTELCANGGICPQMDVEAKDPIVFGYLPATGATKEVIRPTSGTFQITIQNTSSNKLFGILLDAAYNTFDYKIVCNPSTTQSCVPDPTQPGSYTFPSWIQISPLEDKGLCNDITLCKEAANPRTVTISLVQDKTAIPQKNDTYTTTLTIITSNPQVCFHAFCLPIPFGAVRNGSVPVPAKLVVGAPPTVHSVALPPGLKNPGSSAEIIRNILIYLLLCFAFLFPFIECLRIWLSIKDKSNWIPWILLFVSIFFLVIGMLWYGAYLNAYTDLQNSGVQLLISLPIPFILVIGFIFCLASIAIFIGISIITVHQDQTLQELSAQSNQSGKKFWQDPKILFRIGVVLLLVGVLLMFL